MRIALLLSILSLAACRTSHLGACSSDAQCPAGSACDPASAVCVAKAGACFPACDVMHVCNTATLTCDVATTDVAITSPAAGSYASGTLQATATAHAPGGVVSLRFDLSSGGAVVATAQAQVSLSDPASFSAAIPLAAVADGAVSLAAVVTYAGGTAMSAPVALTVDQTPPLITLQTDGRTTFYGAGQIDTAAAQITDATSGVQDTSVALRISGHAAVAGVAGASGAYTFPVAIDDSIVAAGASATLAFQIVATDRAGNAATLSGDPREVIHADRDAPSITGISFTPAGFTDAAGKIFIGGPAGAQVVVQATITDGAGVAASSVCLRIAGETAACPHPGTNTSGNIWSFNFNRPGPGQDGSSPFNFTLEADDSLAAGLSGASKAEHQQRSAQTVYFDYSGPSIAVSPDAKPYARTAVPIPVSALITDPSGVPDGGVFLNGTLQPSTRDGGLFVFQLDPRSAPALAEGAYTFQVSAKDNLNNAADAGATRVIDDLPPSLAIQIYKDAPDGGGVTYPARVANAGWTGATFVYSDTVHVVGTLTDLSGVDGGTLHVDGIDLNGAVTTGTSRPISCGGGTSCPFSIDVTLNDAGTVFHTGTSTFDAGATIGFIPAAALQFTVAAQDNAKSYDGSAAAHTGSTATGARTTRWLWQQVLPGPAVSGLAVHPDGDLIATLDGGAGDTIFALAPDQPLMRWSYGSDAGASVGGPIGDIIGTPAIGIGGGNAALIYVASAIANLYAIGANGSLVWGFATPANVIAVGPAVTQVTIGLNTVDEIVVPDGVGGGGSMLWRGTSATDVTGLASANRDFYAAPMILDGGVYFATQSAGGTTTHLTMHLIAADGTLGSATTAVANGGSPYYGPITDGTNIYATTSATTNGMLQRLDPVFNSIWASDAGTTGYSAEPTIGIDGKLYASSFANTVAAYDAGTGTSTPFATLGGVALVPLQGSDGHIYLPRKLGFLYAYEGNKLSWSFGPPNAILREATMDCSGRLFVASGNTVYAFITDDHGLADTPWPAMRRDSRNTGNASAFKYGMRTISGCTQ
jgi:hypothetical protein